MIEIIIVTSEGCSHCLDLRPAIDQFKDKYPDLCIKEIDIYSPEGAELAKDVEIITLPTVIVTKDCKIVSKNSGVTSSSTLEQLIKNAYE